MHSLSLDHASDTHVQRLLRSKFTSHTIIAVAHKLDTILDFDKVVVMQQGKLVEYGEPYKLLETEGSRFKALYEDGSRVEEVEQDDDVINIAQ
jgi:ABC-type multidrug transport system fused ATPase/permease subunit